jgi:hypothetical protein
LARSQQWNREKWRQQRRQLSDLTREFESLARSRLGGRDRRRTDSDYIFLRGN